MTVLYSVFVFADDIAGLRNQSKLYKHAEVNANLLFPKFSANLLQISRNEVVVDRLLPGTVLWSVPCPPRR